MSQTAQYAEAIDVGPVGSHGIGWWGMIMLMATEGAMFGYLLFSYFYLAIWAPHGWLPEPHPSLTLALPNTALLLASSVAAWWGDRAVRHERRGAALLGLGLAVAMGTLFAVVQWFEWAGKPYGPRSSSYGSIFFITTGLHMAHVIVGLLILALLVLWTALGMFDRRRLLPVKAGVLYWHFVDAVWLTVFASFYVSPYLGIGR